MGARPVVAFPDHRAAAQVRSGAGRGEGSGGRVRCVEHLV